MPLVVSVVVLVFRLGRGSLRLRLRLGRTFPRFDLGTLGSGLRRAGRLDARPAALAADAVDQSPDRLIREGARAAHLVVVARRLAPWSVIAPPLRARLDAALRLARRVGLSRLRGDPV